MTNPEIIAVVSAAEAGKVIECLPIGAKGWRPSPNPTWNFDSYSYRVKPDPREWFCGLMRDGGIGGCGDTREAVASLFTPGTEIIHVREVIE